MISKVMPAGGSFYHTCRYVCQDLNRARILEAEGVRSHDYKLMVWDFEGQRQMRAEKEKAVFHSVLSYSPGEHPSDAQMVELARKYLERIGLEKTQFVITRHIDKDHAHMHIIANRVGNDGKSIDDSWIGLRGKKVAQQLTQEYGLTPALKKNLALTHRENLNESEARRYRIYEAIRDNLPKCRSLADLEKRLLPKGITMRYRYGKSERVRELQGVSFRLDNESFKGSQIDREFSIKRLQETLEKQELKHRLEREERYELRQSRGMRHHR
jgi:Relaxase/Mobilisation nuclease domain